MNTRGKTRGTLKNKSKSHIHYTNNHTRSTRYMNNQREIRYMVEFIPNPMKEMRA